MVHALVIHDNGSLKLIVLQPAVALHFAWHWSSGSGGLPAAVSLLQKKLASKGTAQRAARVLPPQQQQNEETAHHIADCPRADGESRPHLPGMAGTGFPVTLIA